MQPELVPPKPPNFFKYLSPDRVDILSGKQIRYTQPAALNDPFEFKPFIKGLKDIEAMMADLRAMAPGEIAGVLAKQPAEVQARISLEDALRIVGPIENRRHLIEAFMDGACESLKKAVRRLTEAIGMLSLSARWDSLLMWSHYCRGHEGFVIGMDSSHPYFDQRRAQEEFRHVRPVEYREQRPNANLADLDGIDVFLVKSKDWSYEEEWRVLQPLQDSRIVLPDKSPSVHLFPLPPAAVVQVILGTRIEQRVREKIVRIVREDPDYKQVGLFEAVPDERTFSLRLSPVER